MRVTITVQHQDTEDVFSTDLEEVLAYHGQTLSPGNTQKLIQAVADRAKRAYEPPTPG